MSNDKFHRIILPLSNQFYRLALSIVKEQTEAEDIVQDVLLKLWNKRNEWDTIENLEAYCFRSIKNLALDRLVSDAIKKTDSIDAEIESRTFVDTHSPYQEIVQQEQRSIIYQCIEKLTENQKLVFQLREIEGMNYKEISQSLGITEDLVKVSLFRARRKMRELLSNFENFDKNEW
ncbi:MAG TPA: RNA polymerase subunit sigma-70 [Porphyromonadaceae bacterium]|jgi:RNA polymerase sigma-70 factor (ECF subfamily)|uniref:RNA polymerase sigma factor n=1 Tax=Limibacterium fermenti TaxID=3229863 RepID=UPI000E80550F|nr:RNA polymerase subunit sigma-70 [Porphyromonadaceae bacterium]HBK32533.1 RNA polymerase subunit sigma-70 [Porphyromonadaceae bacterium]HBL33704.1 RNA polymerase subunit sigma-70 [Porphyromonadaceae bacterium]HBX18985.1 RNA polymerase subunit sigma-70 [Porphyromonadaceae bacterium]HBX46883.1 RNA polymerase subunit sigma-70 [Porphyromonadaceae bacterium]